MKTFNQKPEIFKADRRAFLKTSTIGLTGIMLGMHVKCSSPIDKCGSGINFSPNVYLSIESNGDIVIVAHRSEMGQGVRTGLPLIVAEELEADWSRVRIVQAEGDEAIYGNQNTDGSFTIRMFYMPMRKAGAAARMLLERAAAEKWDVPLAECKALNHKVIHEASGKELAFCELTEIASRYELPPEDEVILKNESSFKFIGKNIPIVDLEDIVQGKAQYGLDVNPDGVKIAMIERSPVAGGAAVTWNDEKTRAVKGVMDVFEMKAAGFPARFDVPVGGIVVVAETTWAALKGRGLLDIEWEDGINGNYDSDSFKKEMMASAHRPGNRRRDDGNVDVAFKSADKVLESTYTLPHLAHATMEPPCAVAHFKDGFCEIWAPTQHPQWARESVASALGIDVSMVKIHITLLGGGFGRKSKPDYVVEAALISKQVNQPIKLIWTREDDLRHDFYHSPSVQYIKSGLKDNKVVAWNHRSVFPPIGGTTNADETEPSDGEVSLGMVDLPFNIDNIRCETNSAKSQTRIGWLRSVSNIQQAFAIGSMVDEIAYARNMDPVENLLDLLGDDRVLNLPEAVNNFQNYGEPYEDFPSNTARLRKVINRVAEISQWGRAIPEGQGMGICAHRSFLTYVACVVEVRIDDRGRLRIPSIYYAVDCGLPVNRDRIKSQFEGGAVFALSGILKSSINFKKGRTIESNFHDYLIADINDTPDRIVVDIIDSKEKPTGAGEPPVPPVAPALCNAIYAATGKRIKDLPVVM